MKMFTLIDIGERAGNSIPRIFNIWRDESLKDPFIEEQFEPDVLLSLYRFCSCPVWAFVLEGYKISR